jgi:hypothetical protein
MDALNTIEPPHRGLPLEKFVRWDLDSGVSCLVA